ncbi:MAG: 50S ribosomal protein L25/general stress protein Ctc [Gammaproteobacteria bacterium]|nr:50S ribosomal protein L25/general stress protein Ctc [Gammaproteobacteria bacterium]
MSETFEIDAAGRTDTGKGASRRLRHEGLVPGIVYGAHQDPEMIALSHNKLILQLDNEAFYSHILELKVDGKSQSVILKDLQRHPAKPFVLHVDFLRVSADEKLRTHVPLHFIGEDVAPGVKTGGGNVSHLMTDVEVLCLPKNLPEFIEVDVSAMEVGENIMLTALTLPEGVEITSLLQGDDHDQAVVSIHVARGGSDEEEAEVEEAASEEDSEE